jgi:hypothetical protein
VVKGIQKMSIKIFQLLELITAAVLLDAAR